MFVRLLRSIAIAVVLAGSPAYLSASCGSASCSINTSFETQGAYAGPGLRFDARFEFLHNDQLRLGRDKIIKRGGSPLGAHDRSETYNRSLILGLDWSITPKFGISFTLPLIDRDHSNENFPVVDTGDEGTIATAAALNGVRGIRRRPADLLQPAGHLVGLFPEGHAQRWHYRGIGDLRLLARYQWFSAPTRGGGLLFGSRLPTAPNDVEANDGLEPDKGVQPGAGSVDLILGGYFHSRLGEYGTGFIQFTGQGSVYHYPDFRPPNIYSLDLGYRHFFDNYISAFLQLNVQHRGRERGRFGLPENSGADVVYVSPGVGYELTDDLHAYAFVQVPVYQYYEGAQVVPDYGLTAGLSYRY